MTGTAAICILYAVMNQQKPIRILVVDDHKLVREAMAGLINIQPDMKVVAEASDGDVAVHSFSALEPDVVLMDVSMPRMNGVDAVQAIKKKHPAARFIMLSAYDFPEDLQRSVKAGAAAYLLKDTAREKLVRVIREVHNGATFL